MGRQGSDTVLQILLKFRIIVLLLLMCLAEIILTVTLWSLLSKDSIFCNNSLIKAIAVNSSYFSFFWQTINSKSAE